MLSKKEYDKEYYLRNRERILKRVRNYSKQNSDKIRKRREVKKVILEEKRINDTINEKNYALNEQTKVIWRDIKGFEGKYQMSENREIRRLPYTVTQTDGKGNIYTRTFKGVKKVTQRIDCQGYLSVSLNKKSYRIHWLYYNTFIGDSKGYVVDHIDRNKLNNEPSNLRLLTDELNKRNKTMPYRPDIQDYSKYQRYKNKEKSHPYCLRFGENGIRKVIGYFNTYEEAENKYKELYNERQKRIDAVSKVFTVDA